MPLAILTAPRHSLIAAFLVGLTCAPAVALAPSGPTGKERRCQASRTRPKLRQASHQL
jgi:hypothetical protein